VNELERIVQRTRGEVQQRKVQRPIEEVSRAADRRLAQDPPRGFERALAAPGLSVIAEHKRRSPSAGVIREGLELEPVVTAYQRGGARCLSVLTEQVGFGGCLEDLARARAASSLPILRKDFVVDPYQVVEAVAGGADAILLIVAALTPDELDAFHELATGYGLSVLVEVHDAAELEIAAQAAVPIIGINNRDLTTLEVDIERTHELLDEIPPGTVVVSESGLRTAQDLDRLAQAGVDAVLVGEALMRSPDIEAACRALTDRSAVRP
jgi:indole-3-glycerol phosphate synthase